MGRRVSPKEKTCQCDECIAQSAAGVNVASAVFSAHSKAQRLRNLFQSSTISSQLQSNPTNDVPLAPIPTPTPVPRLPEKLQSSAPPGNSFFPPPSPPAAVVLEARLEDVQAEINASIAALYESQTRLEFVTLPSEQMSFMFPDPETLLQVNSGQFSLKTSKACNRRFIKTEGRLCSLLREAQIMPPDEHCRTQKLIEDALYAGLQRLHRFKQREWQSQSSPEEVSHHIIDNTRFFRTWMRQDPITASVLLGALVCYIKFQVPVRRMRFILTWHRGIARALEQRQRIRTDLGSEVSSRIPKDIHTVISRYVLDPSARTFLSCPTCYALYPLADDALSSNEEAYEAHTPFSSCTAKSHPDSAECGTTLWTTRRIGDRTYVVPVRKQIFQDLKEWLGRILAIPGIEHLLTEHQRRSSPSNSENDFWDSPMFHDFKGPDGKPFMKEQPGPTGAPDLRLLMSLGVDSFSPFHMMVGHHHAPSTAMYMVLLVLPEHLRYRREYMFMVTLMSGNPSKHEINHPLKILVDQLLDFWEGIFYIRTADHALGRTVLLALILVVCDSEAAHQVSGFGSHSAKYFCRRCMLTKSQIGENIDPETWPMREIEEHRAQALRWLNASSENEREGLFEANSIRYSELLRLPYFNPITMTTFDDMHMGLLGLVHTHIADVLQVDHKNDGGEGRPVITGKRPSNSVARLLWDEIRENKPDLATKLKDQTRDTLLYLCIELDVRTAGIKDVLIAGILEWRRKFKAEDVPTILPLSYSDDIDHSESGSSQSHSDAPIDTIASDANGTHIEKLVSQMQAKEGPHFSELDTPILQALCEELEIPYNVTDSKKDLTKRLKTYRAERRQKFVSADYAKLKNSFETKEPSWYSLTQYREDYLKQMCIDMKISPFTGNVANPPTPAKREMARRLIIWRREYHPSPLTTPWMNTPQKVLGKDVLEEIANDMKQTILPSWMNPAPHPSLWVRQGGEKLSADEWKVAGTIHVPITLIRIWGYRYENEPKSRHFQILLNYLHMVHALRILFLRETSAALRVEYRTQILDYLRSLRELFPDFSIKPNQHYAVHAVEDLETLGPGHARSTPIWERDNGDLQDMNSNKHPGELEVTRMKSYCRQGNLKLVLDNITDPDLLEHFGEAMNALQAMEQEDHKGMFAGTDLSAWTSPDRDFKTTPTVISESTLDDISKLLSERYKVPLNVFEAKLARDAQILEGVAVMRRVVFSTNIRESSVIFRLGGHHVAGTIKRIISHLHPHPISDSVKTAIFVEVLVLEPIDEADDLYRKLGCGWLCLPSLTRRQLVPLEDILSPFSRTDFWIRNRSVVHVYPETKLLTFHGGFSGYGTMVRY